VGINTPVRLYELLEERKNASPELLEKEETWKAAIAFYENRQFHDASKLFQTLAQGKEDLTLDIYLSWCAKYINNPPGPEWDGVYNLTQK
jgi:adenylate cyclase